MVSEVSVLYGNGDGTFQPKTAYAAGGRPSSVVIADVKGDGNADIITANQADATTSVLLGNGDGSFFQTQATYQTGYSSSIAVADLNEDGRPDLVTATYNSNTVSVLLNQAPTLLGATYNIEASVVVTAVTTSIAENTLTSTPLKVGEISVTGRWTWHGLASSERMRTSSRS